MRLVLTRILLLFAWKKNRFSLASLCGPPKFAAW